LGELLRFFFAPSYATIANQHIEKIETDGPYKKVYLKGIASPVFYPADFPEHSLHMTIVECFNPHNWHHYEVKETGVGPDDIVLDCGAAEGIFGLKVHSGCRQVILIEPLSKFVRALERTFEKADNVQILPYAISDRPFSATISDTDISSAISENGPGEQIEVTTLDALFAGKDIPVSYLKMDLEGHDYKALVGAEKLIKQYKPKIAVTTYHDEKHAEQIKSFLQTIVPEYKIRCKGIYQATGSPVMLHAWI
jgi:FkbM family methyltransferase